MFCIQSVSDDFGALCIKGLTIMLIIICNNVSQCNKTNVTMNSLAKEINSNRNAITSFYRLTWTLQQVFFH